jgi:hypothetical protein
VDLDKAALHGISPADVTRTLQVASRFRVTGIHIRALMVFPSNDL